MNEKGKKEGLRVGGAGNRASRGFSAAEAVISVVVLAILAAYASPKLFGVKEQADATEEILKIKDIEARHSQEMLKAGKRGVNPTLGDVVGFRPEVVAEPAPDEASIKIDFSFAFATNFNSAQYIIRENMPSSYLNDSSQITCGPSTSAMLKPFAYYSTQNWLSSKIISSSFTLLSGSESAVDPGAPVPKCRGEMTGYHGAVNGPGVGATCAGLGLSTTGSPPLCYGWTSGTTNYSLYSVLTDRTLVHGTAGYNGGLAATGWIQDIPAAKYRLTCASRSNEFGVTYLISGATSPNAGVNGSEVGAWQNVSWTYLGTIQTSPRIDAADGITPNVGAAKCVRQGPAPAVPPSDPGDPGAYPMASDHSGYCLSPGRKLPTYRDGAGTPTSSSSDPVMELATEAVDDATNCP